jgi:hypothetical protein
VCQLFFLKKKNALTCKFLKKTIEKQYLFFASIEMAGWQKWSTMISMFGSSLPPVVCRRAHVLFTLFVFAYV